MEMAHSPSQFSVGSSASVSSSNDRFSFGVLSDATPTPGGGAAGRGSATPGGAEGGGLRRAGRHTTSPSGAKPAAGGPAGPFARTVAQSVHVTDGFLWHRMKNAQQKQLLALGKRTGSGAGGAGGTGRKAGRGGRGGAARVAYPPPVLACKPESLNLRFSALDPQAWANFMADMERQVEAALRDGRWKQAARDTGAIAMSCPR
jgi:hypothetical protein